MKTEMKLFVSLPLYIVTTLFAFGCVSALPSAPEHHPKGLSSLPEQDPGILPSLPEQDPGILPSLPEQDPGILENIEETLGKPCPDGWTRFEHYCYLVSSSINTWDQAQKYCQSLGAGLVKINSAEENEFVLNLVKKDAPSLKQVWIGLRWYSNNFYWYDTSVVGYKNWAPGEPSGKANEPCGHMYIGEYFKSLPGRAAGSWNDVGCQANPIWPNGIVCERLP